MTTLQKRVLSALVLAPPILLAFAFGSPYSDIVLLLAVAIAAWEWMRLCRLGRLESRDWLVVLAVFLLGLAAQQGAVTPALAAAPLLGGAAYLLAGRGAARGWIGFGAAYLGLGAIAFIQVYAALPAGWLVLWLLAVVWSTDVFAYLVGSQVGGPKLAPRISPSKTWSGLLGGVSAAALAGALVVEWVTALQQLWTPWAAALAGAILGGVAQGGDLLESRLKRRFGAKDSSHLIPGHGGLLDRIDGVLAASLMLALWLQL